MKHFFKRRPHLIPSLVVAVILLGALAKWPYGYYVFLRWATCGVSVYVIFSAYRWERYWACWLFGLAAVLFNPLVPIHLTREIWAPIDIAAAVLFVVAVFVVREPLPDIEEATESSEHRGNQLPGA